MPRQLTLQTIERRIAALQAQADKAKQRKSAQVMGDIKKLMQANDISLADLKGALNGKGRKRRTGARRGRRGKVAAKYKNPKTGETWSGRGRTAGWLAALEKTGRKRSEFLIKGR
jgi:DNA-binding protein H-NS